MTLTQISSRGVEDTLRWSLGHAGGNYTFTGPGLTGTVSDPTIYLSRGHTYIFENNSGGHPFYIKTSTANGGTNDAYNTGVTNNGGGNGTEIKITVPHDAPDVLYYQCSSHATMAGTIYITGAVADGSISSAKIADDAVISAKIADNPSFTGTSGIKLPIGTTGERVNTEGILRYNSTIDLPEFYNGTSWQPIDTPPAVTSVNNSNPSATQIAAGFDIVITGTSFKSGATVKFVGNDATEHSSPTVVVNSSTQITARVHTSVSNSNEPYDVKVTNASGLSGILEDAFNVNAQPAFTTAAGTVATINDVATGTHATLAATDPEGDTVTFSGTVGGGLTLASSGAITGDPTNVTSATTLSFTATATDTASNTSTRSFNVIVNPTPDGSSAARATANPTALYNDTGINTSGVYWIKASGFNSGTAVQAYFLYDGNNGYLLACNYLHDGGTDPNLNDRTNQSFPLLGSNTLGTDESGTAYWGHVNPGINNGGVGAFGTVNMVRWYGKTNAHSRVVHFENNNTGTINMMNSTNGSGNHSGLNSGYTTLSGHNAYMPGQLSNYGYGWVGFAFYKSSAYHWSVKGSGSRWEVDDFNNDYSQDTLHRGWVRYAS